MSNKSTLRRALRLAGIKASVAGTSNRVRVRLSKPRRGSKITVEGFSVNFYKTETTVFVDAVHTHCSCPDGKSVVFADADRAIAYIVRRAR